MALAIREAAPMATVPARPTSALRAILTATGVSEEAGAAWLGAALVRSAVEPREAVREAVREPAGAERFAPARAEVDLRCAGFLAVVDLPLLEVARVDFAARVPELARVLLLVRVPELARVLLVARVPAVFFGSVAVAIGSPILVALQRGYPTISDR